MTLSYFIRKHIAAVLFAVTGFIVGGALVGGLTFHSCATAARAAVFHAAVFNSCEVIRQTALDECATAFEDSYYAGGMTGKDMDFRLIRDNQRCQNLGQNIFWSCVHNAREGGETSKGG